MTTRGTALYKALGLSLVTCTLWTGPMKAETLADVQADLARLSANVAQLRSELSTTGAANVSVDQGTQGALLDRVTALENALVSLTAANEEANFRLRRGLSEAELQLGDLAFRVCELDPACDIDTLPEDPSLTAPDSAPQTVLAVGEEADFSAAQTAFTEGDFGTAADLLGDFSQTYPGSPLGQKANLLRGDALAELGDDAPAARAFLEAYSIAPSGIDASEALYKLGVSLRDLGQRSEACVTLGQVATRYAGSAFVAPALEASGDMACP
ncbi:MAG: tetratricopeptide repeat protein [Pseudomonadota bacterium]